MASKAKLHVKKGDTVMVISGKEKGKSGKILKINPSKRTVIVEKVNFIKRHSRPTQKAPQGGIIEREGPLTVAKINILCTKCNAPVRIRKQVLDDGKRVRVCAKCGEIALERNVDMTYMGVTRPGPGLVCPKCNEFYVSDGVAKTLKTAESILEEKRA